MRILHVIPALTVGGAERAVVDLANAQVTLGHDIVLLVGSAVDDSPLEHRIDPRVRQVYATSGGSRIGRYVATASWLARNRAFVLGCDVVHGHLTFGALVASAVWALRERRRAPVIVETYHAAGMPISVKQRRLANWLFGQRDVVVLMAEDPLVRAAAGEHGVLVRRINNGQAFRGTLASDDPAVTAWLRAADLDPARPIVGTVGRLVSERSPDLLIEAFGAVAREQPDAQFVMVGDGPERENLFRQARALGFEDRLHLPGGLADIRPALAAIDIFLTVAVTDTIGMAAVEATFAGLPVIGAQLLRSYEAQPDDAVWTSSDPQAVGQEALRLLRSRADRDALAARQHATMHELYSVDAAARNYDRLYAELLGRAD